MEILLTLLILSAAVVLFATDWVRMELVGLMILLALALTRLVTVEEAFAGFSSPAVITVAAMFVLGAGISSTGAISRVGELLITWTGHSETLMIAAIMATVAFFSAFINNIGATAILMPIVVVMARRLNKPPSKLLIPLAFGSLLGGVCTGIGTPPNILMGELLHEYTGESFSMFDYTPVGISFVIVGIVYMVTAGRHLLPKRKAGTLTESYQVKEYITEVEVLAGSPLSGKTLAKSFLESEHGLHIRAILRNGIKIPQPRRNRLVREGDILFLEGNPEAILRLRKEKGLAVVPERDNPAAMARGEKLVVVEASLAPTCQMVGKTLRELRFAETHGLTVLAIWRQAAPVVKKVDRVLLRFGDVLLLQGTEAKVRHLADEHGFLLLGGVDARPYRPRRAPLAVGIMSAVVLASASGAVPITVAATAGALLIVLTRCLTLKEAYACIDWPIILLIAGTLPLGKALENSGAAGMLGHFITDLLGSFGPWAILMALFLIASLLTEVMSHAAAAVLLAPIAFDLAMEMSVSPKPFFMAVAIAASMCFMTPVSHQSNALVMGPGGYRFTDYTRVGAPLNLITWLVGTLLVPIFFPF
jgi:di/tricarboxylate transporter